MSKLENNSIITYLHAPTPVWTFWERCFFKSYNIDSCSHWFSDNNMHFTKAQLNLCSFFLVPVFPRELYSWQKVRKFFHTCFGHCLVDLIKNWNVLRIYLIKISTESQTRMLVLLNRGARYLGIRNIFSIQYGKLKAIFSSLCFFLPISFSKIYF